MGMLYEYDGIELAAMGLSPMKQYLVYANGRKRREILNEDEDGMTVSDTEEDILGEDEG